MFGLPAALFEAGACGVIGALWPVADAVAPILMNALHEGLAEGAPPELALKKAYPTDPFVARTRHEISSTGRRCFTRRSVGSNGRRQAAHDAAFRV